MIRSARLQRPDCLRHIGGHLLDAAQFLARHQGHAISSHKQADRAKMAREIDVAPKHSAAGAVNEK